MESRVAWTFVYEIGEIGKSYFLFENGKTVRLTIGSLFSLYFYLSNFVFKRRTNENYKTNEFMYSMDALTFSVLP